MFPWTRIRPNAVIFLQNFPVIVFICIDVIFTCHFEIMLTIYLCFRKGALSCQGCDFSVLGYKRSENCRISFLRMEVYCYYWKILGETVEEESE